MAMQFDLPEGETPTPEQAEQFLASVEAINLEEVTIETIRVAIRDRDESGKAYVRKVDLESFVPMRIFNKMLASRQRIVKERERFLAGNSATDADPIIGWMVDQVLAVWQLTEPSMTRERLEDGLPFENLSALFSRFFGRVLRNSQRAPSPRIGPSNHTSRMEISKR